ncbi:hypothetical protein B0T16DRAFT_391564 [Cercophora newfieldiana]|uniref:Uncharacterized protein n=1 Tax=Cercophora newfieldiana TaxID=92897 RepID=A0AA40CLL8_9PEZI|nr:hypothetical protein B0T16DRAFT_391564 [Cercophora newfieldiana]
MASPRERPRLRFAPIPIETTFEKYRTNAPPGELTPSPSPRSPSPPPRERRRFAPQLVESSVRRSRRAGDEGPATRPTDKTDITPYTNHIYVPKPRKKPSHAGLQAAPSRQEGHGRRESCDDEIAGGFFNLVARDAQQKLQEVEVAMSAFPNSGQRIGGAEHFYVREGSEDDSLRGRPKIRGPWDHMQSRRNSSEEDISWAIKEMQEHALLASGRNRDRDGDRDHHHMADRVDTLDLDNMSIGSPPSDAMGLTRTARQSLTSSPLWTSRPPSTSLGPIGEAHMPLLRAESPLPAIGESFMPYIPPESPAIRPIGETFMPYIPSAPPGKSAAMPYAPASQIPPETGFGRHSPFLPFPQERDMSLERARNAHRMRAKASPPMLGQDLKFRMCPSPKQTKLEPDHLWDLEKGTTMEGSNRDYSEEHGLWRGYCYTDNKSEKLVLVDRPAMLNTPMPPPSPGDPFARAFGTAPILFSEEPSPTAASRAGTLPAPKSAQISPSLHVEHRKRSHVPKGLHMIQNLKGLDERLKHEKEAAELEEKIAAEFDDHFVTQVYNYLSLGYPALARQYDEELSKISRISVDELEADDMAIMDNLWGAEEHHRGQANGHAINGVNGGGGYQSKHVLSNGKKVKATGHIMLDSEEKDGVREEDRCPRWKALKLYIYEWARQHPDLDGISPLAWGVRERRGSWGV